MPEAPKKPRNLVFGKPFTKEAVDRMNQLMRAFESNDEVEKGRILDEIWESMQKNRRGPSDEGSKTKPTT